MTSPTTRRTINADYTAPALKRAILNMLYWLASLVFAFVKRRHIARIVGLENLPSSGPFVIVANHLSYMDDFLVAYVIRAYYGQKLYIPTNKKAFKGVMRSWLHLAGGAVEIDPDDREQSYQTLRQLVEDRRIILMFPEGTRSDGAALLPFKFGAFNLARDLKLTMVPVALIDTHRVLPKHSLRLTPGAKASAVFLPAIAPDVFDSQDVASVKESCRSTLAGCIHGDRVWMGPAAAQASVRHLAFRAECWLEALIERGPDTIRGRELQPVFRWAELARHSQTDTYPMEVQFFRAFGFRLLCAAKPVAPLLLRRFHKLGASALRRDPHQPFVHYVHGQFHLRAPWIVGGRKRVALAALDHAYRWAARYGVGRERFTVSYAEALARNGYGSRAQRLLQRDFEGLHADSERLKRRAQRAAALLQKLRSAPS